MESLSALRITMVFCLGIGSYAMTSGTVTMPTEAGELRSNTLTTLNVINDVHNGLALGETTLSGGAEPVAESTTTGNYVTTDDVVTKMKNFTVELQTNKTIDFKTTPNEIPSTTLFTTTMTSRDQHSTTFYSTIGPDENVLTTESVNRSTKNEGVLHSPDTVSTVPSQRAVMESLKYNRVHSTDQMEETTGHQTTTKPFLSTVEKVPESHAEQKREGPIHRDRADTQTMSGDVVKPNSEIASQTKVFDENNLYYNSPQYIQRKTINHAAVWITVGFVAILLTYILALFIHEKGRAEWRMATQNYSQFENESTQDEDSTSITMDLDEPSTPFTVTSAVIETTSTQNLMLKQSRKSH